MKKNSLALLLTLIMIFSLSSCGKDSSGTEDEYTERPPVQTVELGSSNVTFDASENYKMSKPSGEEAASGMLAHYTSESSPVDFDVYELQKTPGKSLEELANEDAAQYSALVSTSTIKDMPSAVYVADVPVGEDEWKSATVYFLDADSCYIKVVFWLKASNASEEIADIVSTIKCN